MASFLTQENPGRSVLHTWNLTTADPIGAAVSHPGATDRSIQFVADTKGSATIVLQGSNDDPVNDNWITLTDGQGNTISFTDSGGEMVAENMLHYRVILTTVGSDAVWTAFLFSRSTMR